MTMRFSGLLEASRLAVFGAVLVGSMPSFAALAVVAMVPMGWRLQNYTTNNVKIYYTGATACGPWQSLLLGGSFSADDKNWFWTIIMIPKAVRKKVFVYYNDATCAISSFGLLENGYFPNLAGTIYLY